MSVIKSSRWELPNMLPEEEALNSELRVVGRQVRQAMEDILPRKRMHWGTLKSHEAVMLSAGTKLGDLLYRTELKEPVSNRKVSLWLERPNKENDEPISLIGYDRDTTFKERAFKKNRPVDRTTVQLEPEETQNLRNVLAIVNFAGQLVNLHAIEQAPSVKLFMMHRIHDTLPEMANQQSDEYVRAYNAPVSGINM
jgi:hypothetical protein